MKKDDFIVYPPEAGPQAAFSRVTTASAPPPEEPPAAGGGLLAAGWLFFLLAGLLWGCLVWVFGNGTDPVSVLDVLETAPGYSKLVLYGLLGGAVLMSGLAFLRGRIGGAILLDMGGLVLVALCLTGGTILREKTGRLTLPAALLGALRDSIVLQKKDGWEIRATSISLEGGTVKAIVNGKPVEIPLSDLDAGSQQRVKEAVTTKP